MSKFWFIRISLIGQNGEKFKQSPVFNLSTRRDKRVEGIEEFEGIEGAFPSSPLKLKPLTALLLLYYGVLYGCYSPTPRVLQMTCFFFTRPQL
jgi:hypothetical protein